VQRTAQVEEVLRLAESVVGGIGPRPCDGAPGDHARTEQVALARAESAVLDALHQRNPPRPGPATEADRSALLNVLLTQIRLLRNASTEAALDRRSLSDVRRVVNRLRPITSVAQLLAGAPAAIGQLGYSRVLVSRLDGGTWLPCSAFAYEGPELAAGMVRAGSVRPRRLNGALLEADMVRTRRPMLVRDAQNRPRMHPELVPYTETTAYVAAPLISRNNVVGLLHADKNTCGEVDDFDPELLGLFAECLGVVVERAVLHERLQALRLRMDEYSSSFHDLLGEFLPPAPAVGEPERPRPARAVDNGALEQLGLTRREAEVLREMATGKSNAQIAEALYIGEGTVKSHVKSVLRKLTAANRADAVSRYFRLALGS
jgi:DNA-binding CsgD family transcriptional regulator